MQAGPQGEEATRSGQGVAPGVAHGRKVDRRSSHQECRQVGGGQDFDCEGSVCPGCPINGRGCDAFPCRHVYTVAMSLDHLFDSNRAWARDVEQRTPGFFSRLQQQQSPEYLWIGCSDSRVPANEICGVLPGEMFVHRNVANVVAHSDLNCLSVMQFAIDMLKVKHIMVVGHYGCGGVRAAMDDLRIGIVDNWIRHVKDVRNSHLDWLNTVPEGPLRYDALCELNVLQQCFNVCQTTMVEDAWARGQEIVVHGWVYGIQNGLINDLRMSVKSSADVVPAYEKAVAQVRERYATDVAALLPQ
ncbi:MAG: carbonate dehydratase [Aquabacterium sp.]|nr:MAG: carbonate dehydratase [Aquabacterium sp.]